MHVAVWYHGIPGQRFTKFLEYVSIGQTLKVDKFRGARTKSVRNIRCGEILFPRKVDQSSPLVDSIPDLLAIDRP